MVVVVAVEALAKQGDSTQFIHDGSNTDMDEFFVGSVTVGDVGRRDVGVGLWGPRCCFGSWLRSLVSAVEDEMGGVEVEALG